MKLRKYQKQAIEEVEGHFAFSDHQCCIVAPTGAGKSVIIAQLVQDFMNQGLSVCVMVNITKLIYQLSDTFDEFGIAHNIHKANCNKQPKKLSMKCSIIMQQTLASRKDLVPECDVLIVDERHLSFGSNTMKEIERRLKPRMIIGLSATPVDGNGAKLDGVDIIQTVDIKQLTEEGYLTPIKTYVAGFSEKLDFSDVDIGVGGDFSEPQLATIINTEAYNEEVVRQWKQITGYENGQVQM